MGGQGGHHPGFSRSWLYLKERSQPTKSSFCETLFENIFQHYCPCQFRLIVEAKIKLYKNKYVFFNDFLVASVPAFGPLGLYVCCALH